ncbi:MAG: response regulator [Desulfuromonadales bacterium]|nr:response regulator [Desulfuromonadales bacterium]
MKKTVLAVDDSATVREVLRTTLEGAGYRVMLASDGVEAKKKISNTPENHIDMVLTDLNMPNMNGIELIREVRQQPGYRFKPIMMLTNENQADIKKEGKAAGASCWLNKPFSPEKLLAVVQMVLPA